MCEGFNKPTSALLHTLYLYDFMITSQLLPSWTCQGCILPAIYFQVEHVKDAYSLCHYTSNNCWVSHGTSSSQENKNIPFTPKFREEPMLNQNIIDPPQWTISPHCFCCHTSSGPARSSSNYTRMVKRKSWVHLPDSLRPVLSTNSKPQDSHEKKLENQVFNKTLGWFPTPPRNVANPFKLRSLFARIQGWGHP